MPKIKYSNISMGDDRLAKITTANKIIADYQQQGYDLTLRQLYYQFVAKDIIPNTMRDYKNLGTIINDGRMAGLIDWNAIVDRTRAVSTIASWDSPEEIIGSCASQFKYDLWEDQPRRVEVWIEKEALAGVIERACEQHRVPFLSCRGYTSQSEMWGAAMRLKNHISNGQEPLIIHLGDHDPSGIDMTRDIVDRLELFCGQAIEIKRIALNMDQVEEHNPPPNPAKITDSRADKYIERFGSESWELDALEPSLLDQLISTEIEDVRDPFLWEKAQKREEEARKQIGLVSDKWDSVVAFVKPKKKKK